MTNTFMKFRELRRSLLHWSGRGVLSILDQGLISGSNFLITLLLARWLSPQQYGSYAVAFEVFLFISALYGSLMLEPMSVFGPSLYSGNLLRYVGGLLRIHCVMSCVMTMSLFGVAAVVHALKPKSLLPDALVGVSIAAPCLMLFWLTRRGFYVVFKPQKAVMGASIYSLVLIAGVAVLYKTKALSPLSAFLLLAVGALVTGPVMLRWLKEGLAPQRTGPSVMDIVRRHWTYGRWALANSLVTWMSAGVYYPLLGSLFTLAAAGRFKALMNLSSPIGQAFVAISLLSLPLASRAHHQDGKAAPRRLVWRLTLIYLGGTAAYWVVMLLLRAPIVHHLYAGRYLQVINLLPWVALGSILRISASAQTLSLKAMHMPGKAFISYCTGTVVALALVVPCARWWGLRGALFAWIFSGAAAFLSAVVVVRRVSRPLQVAPRPPAEALIVVEEVSLSGR